MKQVLEIGCLHTLDTIISFRQRNMCVRSGKYVDLALNSSRCWRLCNRSFNSCCYGVRVPDVKVQKIPLVKTSKNGNCGYISLLKVKSISEII